MEWGFWVLLGLWLLVLVLEQKVFSSSQSRSCLVHLPLIIRAPIILAMLLLSLILLDTTDLLVSLTISILATAVLGAHKPLGMAWPGSVSDLITYYFIWFSILFPPIIAISFIKRLF